MSPDSPLGKLAQRVASLEQRMEDVIARFTERVAEMAAELRRLGDRHDSDIRSFAPLVEEHHELRADLRHIAEKVTDLRSDITAAITEFRRGLDEIEERLMVEAKDRLQVREQREEREKERELLHQKDVRAQRMMLRVAAVGLFGTFLTSTAAVLAAVLGGGS